MDKQYANSWQIPTSRRQRKPCCLSPPSRKALIKGTLVWMLLVAVLTCSIRSQPTAPGSLLQHLFFPLQHSSSYSILKYSARNTRRKYDTPLLTVALTTLTHPNQRGSMSVVSSAAACRPQERCLPHAVGELEAPRQLALLLPPPRRAAGGWSCACTSRWALCEREPGRLQA